jgi:hypothetical protein
MGRLWKSAEGREMPRAGLERDRLSLEERTVALSPGAPPLYSRGGRDSSTLGVSWVRQARQLPPRGRSLKFPTR